MLRLAADQYRLQQSRQSVTIAATRRLWAQVGDDLDAGWASITARLVALVAASQAGAALDAAEYVPAVLGEQRADYRPAFAPSASSFVGAYSLDGQVLGDLDTVLYGAVVKARTAPATTLPERLAAGGRWLDLAVHEQVAEAHRAATATTVAADARLSWTRMVNPPCCKRCAVLAGRVYRWSRGFNRHPGCDCTHVPTLEASADDARISIRPADVKDLTIAQRAAIDAGADMGQVVNAEARTSADRMTTTYGTTQRAWAATVRRELGVNTARRARPTPKALLAMARDDHAELTRLLAEHGYIVGDLQRVAAMARAT